MKISPLRLAALALAAFVLSACAKQAEEARTPATPEQQKPDDPPKPKPDPPKVDPGQPKPKGPGKGAKGPGIAAAPLQSLSGLFPLGGGGAARPADPDALTKKHTAALVGTWAADLGGGATEELTYKEDGTYTVALKGPAPQTAAGKYTVVGLSGTRGLKLKLDANGSSRTVHAVFEGDELLHPALQPGVTGTYRKKK